VHLPTLRRLAQSATELLLLPFEGMHRLGVLKHVDPQRVAYTIFSHQWETRDHPFTDLAQVAENLHCVRTDFLWCDWWCAPQWSRKGAADDSMAMNLFRNTMRTFHKLCLHAALALVVLKRRPSGLYLATRDLAGCTLPPLHVY
jgi:hypothetical protein